MNIIIDIYLEGSNEQVDLFEYLQKMSLMIDSKKLHNQYPHFRQQQSQMDKFDISTLYRSQIRQWSESIQKSNPSEDYYAKFIQKIYNTAKLYVTYDNKIVDVIMKMLKSFQFQVYSKDPLQGEMNPRRRILFEIIEVLYSQCFIGKQNYYYLIMQKQVFLQNKLKEFLEICDQSQPGKGQIKNLWEMVIEIDMITFWNLMQENHIKDLLLIQVYQKICKCDPLLHDESTLNYIQSIKKNTQNVNQPRPNFIRIPSKRQKNVEERRQIQQPLVLTSTELTEISKFRANFKREKLKLYDELWFNTAKYKKYQEYMRNVNKSQNNIEISLTSFAFDQSLFFNEIHKSKLQNINRFIDDVQKCLQNNRIVSYEFFGSIRSTLALASEFDIDLTSIRSTSSRGQPRHDSRQTIISVLFSIRKTLSQSNPLWVRKAFVYNFEKIKVPFLKIQFAKQELERQFKLSCLDKMDITIGNKSAIKNSEMISYFARIPEITCFCLLVKLWAKSNHVINAQTPMKGLSSYGVILMCLYILMDSAQVDYLQAPEDFDFQKEEITPNFDSCKVSNIEQNFNGFLNFYKQTGIFQRKRKIVCLLKDCKKAHEMFDDDVVYNMYDFIDKSNPGRLRCGDKFHIFDQIQKAIKIMKTKNVIFIRQLITGVAT